MHGFNKKELLELAWEKPIWAQLEITNRCNQDCIFCFASYKEKQKEPGLTLKQWKIIVNKLRNLGIKRLDFSGRESFMSPYFFDLVKWCSKEGLEININTNGTFNPTKILPYVNELVFSIHGIKEIHDRIAGYKGSFKLIEENFKRATQFGAKATINMFLVKSNYHQIMELFEYFNSKYNVHRFSPALPIPSRLGSAFDDQTINMTQELLQDYIHILKQIPEEKLLLKHGFQSIFINEPDHYKDRDSLLLPNCAGGKYKLIVEADGGVFPCSFFKSDDWYCGNILTDNEYKIWKNGKGFLPFRQLITKNEVPTKCNSCYKKPRCFSGCRAWTKSYQEGGFNNDEDLRCDLGNARIGSRNNN